MTRDWLLIRAILNEEPTPEVMWATPVIVGHYFICEDRGLLCGRGVIKDGQVVSYQMDRLTVAGHEMAAKLKNVTHLAGALLVLDNKGIGHSEEAVIWLIRQQEIKALAQ
jgi:hypothetical protein